MVHPEGVVAIVAAFGLGAYFSEGQRFTTKLLAERVSPASTSAAPPARPDSR